MPLIPGEIDFDVPDAPRSHRFGDVYHPASGALPQAEHVFLRGNGLPGRWAGRHRFVVVETGFGLGNNFLATCNAWRQDPARCDVLHFVSVEAHPLPVSDLRRAHAASPLRELADALVAQWPLATQGFHPIEFEGGRVRLLLLFGDVQPMLSSLQCDADAFFLDGFAPARNPDMWTPDVFNRLARLAAPGATAATWSVAVAVREGLAKAGFEATSAPGAGGKREITVARHAPHHVARKPAAWVNRAQAGHALVIGGGLAGAAAARALAADGWHCTLLDRQPAPARETSSNAAALMHGTFNAPDSLHARWHRASAVLTRRLMAGPIAAGAVAGQLLGFLRCDLKTSSDAAASALESVGLPAEYVRWIDADDARRSSGLALPAGGWWYPGGGWIEPAAAVAHWLDGCGPSLRLVPGRQVQSLRRQGASWQAYDASGDVIAEAAVVVLANALDAPRLLRSVTGIELQLSAVRGQTTLIPAGTPGLRRVPYPVAGNGYIAPLPDGRALAGATSQHDDADASLRAADHRHNLGQAVRLGALDATAAEQLLARADSLEGRTGWRAVTPDRLPLVGPPVDLAAMQAAAASSHRLDAARHLPRLHDETQGLYLLTGLGSRGMTTALLCGQLLAAWVTGAPSPVEADLRDAVDPARFTLRGRRSQAPSD